jgi:hypothetical protein
LESGDGAFERQNANNFPFQSCQFSAPHQVKDHIGCAIGGYSCRAQDRAMIYFIVTIAAFPDMGDANPRGDRNAARDRFCVSAF